MNYDHVTLVFGPSTASQHYFAAVQSLCSVIIDDMSTTRVQPSWAKTSSPLQAVSSSDAAKASVSAKSKASSGSWPGLGMRVLSGVQECETYN
jgi:hypothetical protein